LASVLIQSDPVLIRAHLCWVGKHLAQGAAAEELLLKMTHDPAHYRLDLKTEGLTANKISVIEQLNFKNKGIRHRLTGDPLHNRRQASDFQLVTSWVNPEQESRPCHVCP